MTTTNKRFNAKNGVSVGVNYTDVIDPNGTVRSPEARFVNASNFYQALRSNPAATSNVTWTLPATDGIAGQVPATDGAGNLVWSTGGSLSTVSDSLFRVHDNADATKQMALEVSAISPSTTRTLTVPNRNLQLGSIHNWAAGINYIVGDVVYDPATKRIHRCISSHTSSVSILNNIANWEWVVSNNNITDFNDVTITSPLNGHTLVHNGTEWVNRFPLVASFYSGTIGFVTGNTTIVTNATPTNTQGTEILSFTLTPKSTASKLKFSITSMGAVATSSRAYILTLFAGATFLNAAAVWLNASQPDTISLDYVYSPNTTSPVTLSVRAGIGGGAGTWFVTSGQVSTMGFGGSVRTVWSIVEYI